MNRRPLTVASAALAALVALHLPAREAAAQTVTPTPSPTSVPVPDLAFILKVAQGNMEEVALGELARQRGGSKEVQAFAERMVSDHRELHRQLSGLAAGKGIEPPGEGAGPVAQMLGAALSERSGAEFDEQYIAHQVAAHQATLDLFEFAADHATDEAVKDFARKHGGTIQQHFSEAQSLMKSLPKSPTRTP